MSATAELLNVAKLQKLTNVVKMLHLSNNKPKQHCYKGDRKQYPSLAIAEGGKSVHRFVKLSESYHDFIPDFISRVQERTIGSHTAKSNRD